MAQLLHEFIKQFVLVSKGKSMYALNLHDKFLVEFDYSNNVVQAFEFKPISSWLGLGPMKPSTKI